MEKEQVNHPSHYGQYPIETIDMMERIFGREKTLWWCIMTAFKYRMRMGHKDPIEQDLAKERWYLDYAEKLRAVLEGADVIEMPSEEDVYNEEFKTNHYLFCVDGAAVVGSHQEGFKHCFDWLKSKIVK